MLTPRDFDAIAQALTPALLDPYVPPARPFVLGTPASFGVRPGYAARASVSHTVAASTHAGVARIASAIASALQCDVGTPDGVGVSDGALERSGDPAALLDRWRTARVVVVSTTLRAFTMDGDDEGPPADASCYRQWTLPELQAWLDAVGFECLFGGTLPGSVSDQPIGVVVITAHTAAARLTAPVAS